jgi:hypothetical protein
MLQRSSLLLLLPVLALVASACAHGSNADVAPPQPIPANAITPSPTNDVTPSPTPIRGNSSPGLINTVTLLDVVGHNVLADGTPGLFRFTGDAHSWTTGVSVPNSVEGARLVGLRLTVATGADDLRGMSGDGINNTLDNADAIVRFVSAGNVTFSNINGGARWGFATSNTVDLNLSRLPTSTTVGSIETLTIRTQFAGGTNGDNWDISQVTLVATIQQ